MTWLGYVLAVLAALSLVPVVVLLLQVAVAVLPARRALRVCSLGTPRPRVVVLVPAHDEAAGIAASLRTIVPQLGAGDRLLVVADNCSDETAAIAAAAGAEVLERHDDQRRGKGYALDHGIRHLEADPPSVVIVVDADCELHPGSLDRLACQAAGLSRPVQSLDLMHAPPGAGLRMRIAAFAWAVKNQARPLGAHRLGWPCQLMGTGMAFPWQLIRDASLASSHLVEDMKLGLELAAAGAAPVFCPEALVTSTFPSDAPGAADQRARWEGGHLGVMLSEAPRALWQSLIKGRPGLTVMVLDLCVPPLSVLVLALMLQALADALFSAVGGTSVPLFLASAALALLVVAVALAWAGFGRGIVSLIDLLGAPFYALGKLPLYARFLRRGNRRWVRARRDDLE